MTFLNRFLSAIAKNHTFRCIKSQGIGLLRTPFKLRNFSDLARNGYDVGTKDCIPILQSLGDAGDLISGEQIHSFLIKTGWSQEVFVQNNLIRFYSMCGDLSSAHQVFDEISEPNLVSWTSLVSAYIHDGRVDTGLCMFLRMFRTGLMPNEFGFSVVLKACRMINQFVLGESIHGLILKCGLELSKFCSSSILGVYVESGDVKKVHKFFHAIPQWCRSEALCNMFLESCVLSCDLVEANNLFQQMGYFNIRPNCFTYAIMFKLCAAALVADFARLFHGKIVKIGFESDLVVGGALVDSYSNLGFLDDAYKVFKNLEGNDNMVFCALLAGHIQHGNPDQGLHLFLDFISEGNKPDPFTFASVFSLCSKSAIEGIGSQVHCSLIKHGFIMDPVIGSAIVNMYGNIGMISEAYKCFLEVESKNTICFSAMINYFLLDSRHDMALELFFKMRTLALELCQSTVSYVVRAYAHLNLLREGKSLHSYTLKHFIDIDLCLQNALIEMYVKCGLVEKAETLFNAMMIPNEFSWTTVITGYSDLGQSQKAFSIFQNMLLSPVPVTPSQYTIVPLLQVCCSGETFLAGKQVHGYVIKAGFEHNLYVGSALINMYAGFKHESESAFLVFISMSQQDIVLWSSMITAWAQNGYYREALLLFVKFQNDSIFSVDESILVSCLSACTALTSLEIGKCFHALCMKTGIESSVHAASSIIDMYSKCGSIRDAYKFFEGSRKQTVVTWTAMISAYAYHGLGIEAIQLFDEMKAAGFKPDELTFTGVLTACSHAGLLAEGWKLFESMRTEYNMEVSIAHYTCMVDLLGRLEKVTEAEALINEAPFESKTQLWKILLGACSTHQNFEKGKQIAEMLIELEPNEPTTYVMLSNIYAAASMWNHKVEVRNKMKYEYVQKEPGYSRVGVVS
nr:pentatricopeptide repeat-containing protein At5g27110-like [Ipomoea trifida]